MSDRRRGLFLLPALALLLACRDAWSGAPAAAPPLVTEVGRAAVAVASEMIRPVAEVYRGTSSESRKSIGGPSRNPIGENEPIRPMMMRVNRIGIPYASEKRLKR